MKACQRGEMPYRPAGAQLSEQLQTSEKQEDSSEEPEDVLSDTSDEFDIFEVSAMANPPFVTIEDFERQQTQEISQQALSPIKEPPPLKPVHNPKNTTAPSVTVIQNDIDAKTTFELWHRCPTW